MRDRKPTDDRPRDRKRSQAARSETLARKRAREAKRAMRAGAIR